MLDHSEHGRNLLPEFGCCFCRCRCGAGGDGDIDGYGFMQNDQDLIWFGKTTEGFRSGTGQRFGRTAPPPNSTCIHIAARHLKGVAS